MNTKRKVIDTNTNLRSSLPWFLPPLFASHVPPARVLCCFRVPCLGYVFHEINVPSAQFRVRGSTSETYEDIRSARGREGGREGEKPVFEGWCYNQQTVGLVTIDCKGQY